MPINFFRCIICNVSYVAVRVPPFQFENVGVWGSIFEMLTAVMNVVQTWEMYKYWSIFIFFTQDSQNFSQNLTHFFYLENLWILVDAWCAKVDTRECFKEKAVVHRYKPLQLSRKFDCGLAICKMLRYGALPNCSFSGWTIYQ